MDEISCHASLSARTLPGSIRRAQGLALLLYTVKRRGDVVRMRRRHVRGGMDAVRPIPSGVRVSIATGHTDMRRGMQGLALTVQESLKRDPHAGDLYIFRGRRGDLAKILWHDGIGLSLYAKRLDRGKVHLALGVVGRGVDLSSADGLYAACCAEASPTPLRADRSVDASAVLRFTKRAAWARQTSGKC
jgi:transposase